jgi:hypothetical protein
MEGNSYMMKTAGIRTEKINLQKFTDHIKYHTMHIGFSLFILSVKLRVKGNDALNIEAKCGTLWPDCIDTENELNLVVVGS